MTNLSMISLPLLLVVLSVTIASPVEWPDKIDDGNCDGVVGASIGNCNLNCQTTDRDGFEIEGDDLSNLILFLFCNLKEITYNNNSNSGITTPIEDCVTFADHYNETNLQDALISTSGSGVQVCCPLPAGVAGNIKSDASSDQVLVACSTYS